MPSSAIVPSTEMRTSTIGATAMNASAGWRTVAQKKMARTPMATATVVLIACVCESVISSVTVIEMMLNEVAVTASSSPDQSSSICSWISLVAAGSCEYAGNWSSIASLPAGSLTRLRATAGSLASSLSRKSCISSGSSSNPADASRKSAASSGSYLSPGSPLSSVQSRTSSPYDTWIGPAAACGRRCSSSKAVVRSCRFRSVRVSEASAFTSTLAISVEPPTAASRLSRSFSTVPLLGRMSRMLKPDSSPVAANPSTVVSASTTTK